MQIVIYLEENFRTSDLALALRIFSQENGFDTFVAGKRAGKITSLSNLEIAVNYSVLDLPATDAIIILGGEGVQADFLGLNDYIYKNMSNLKAVCALSAAAFFVAKSGLFTENALTMPTELYKKEKKNFKNYQLAPVVVSDNLITTAIPSFSVNAYYQVLDLLMLDSSEIFTSQNLALAPLVFDKNYKKMLKSFAKANNNYIKNLKRKNTAKYEATCYLFENMRAVDILMLDNILSHLSYRVNYIADVSGMIAGDIGIEFSAPNAIKTAGKTDLLIIPSGEGIERCIVSSFLRHWLEKMALLSYRILTIGEGEKLIGVSGALRDVDVDYLNSLALGEGKFLLTKDNNQAIGALKKIASKDYKFDVELFDKYFNI